MREYEVLRAKWAKKSKRKKLVTAKPIAPDHWITPFILKRFCAVAFVGALCTSHSGKGFVLVDGSKNNLVYFYGIYDHLIGFRKLMFGRVRQNEIFYLFMAVSRNVSCMFSYSGDLTSDTSSLAAGAYDLFSLGDTKDMLQATNCITASAYHLKQGFAAEQQSLVAMLYRSFETGMHNPTQDEIMIVYYSIHFGNHLLVWMLPMFFMTWYLEINREGFFTKSPAYIDYIALAFTKSYPFHKLARNVVLIMLSGVPEDMQYVEWSATPAHGDPETLYNAATTFTRAYLQAFMPKRINGADARFAPYADISSDTYSDNPIVRDADDAQDDGDVSAADDGNVSAADDDNAPVADDGDVSSVDGDNAPVDNAPVDNAPRCVVNAPVDNAPRCVVNAPVDNAPRCVVDAPRCVVNAPVADDGDVSAADGDPAPVADDGDVSAADGDPTPVADDGNAPVADDGNTAVAEDTIPSTLKQLFETSDTPIKDPQSMCKLVGPFISRALQLDPSSCLLQEALKFINTGAGDTSTRPKDWVCTTGNLHAIVGMLNGDQVLIEDRHAASHQVDTRDSVVPPTATAPNHVDNDAEFLAELERFATGE
ncbi:hypothetical protein T484DRAFT_3629592 [Baffinella frigidus]|nr:hypothetical protein T484DRAFT_3629592 [Cryptophyta sp. CCMP2293]